VQPRRATDIGVVDESTCRKATPQRDCRGFESRPADSGGQRNRRGPIFSIGFLKPKLFRAGR
jgi:hypothetical protein